MRTDPQEEVARMRRQGGAIVTALFGAALFAAFGAAPAMAGVNVNVNIGPPAVVVAEPPEVVAVPQSMVYFAPRVSAELLFYEGYWWTPKEGRWFRARAYDGPWTIVGPRYVPAEIVRLPRDYRSVYVRGEHVPYGQLKKHWRHREIERRERRGEWKGWKEDRKEARKEQKAREKAHKERAKDHREREMDRDRDRDGDRGGNGHGRGR